MYRTEMLQETNLSKKIIGKNIEREMSVEIAQREKKAKRMHKTYYL